MNKKILIVIGIIAILIVGVGVYLILSEESTPDFEVNGEVVEVNETFNVDGKNNTVISLSGSNFTIPNDFKGNLSYQSNSPKADFKNEDEYFTIISLGKGDVKEFANQFIENNKGFTLGKETEKNNITFIEINQGSDVISKMYYVQIGENVYDINLFGIKIQDLVIFK